MNPLLDMLGHFALLSLLAIGGVSTTLPEMHRYLVDVRHWLTHEQFTALYALSQASPGPNLLFVALFGWQIFGVLGALVAMLGTCGPSCLIALSYELLAGRDARARWPELVRRGLTPLSIGLLLSTGWILANNPEGSWKTLLASLATIAVTLRWNKLHPLWLIAAGALLGGAGWLD